MFCILGQNCRFSIVQKETERNKIPEKCFEKKENKKKEFQTENKRVKIQIESRNK